MRRKLPPFVDFTWGSCDLLSGMDGLLQRAIDGGLTSRNRLWGLANWQPAVNARRHSAGDASPLAALRRVQIFPIFSLVAPCQRGASSPSVPRRTFTTSCWATVIMMVAFASPGSAQPNDVDEHGHPPGHDDVSRGHRALVRADG